MQAGITIILRVLSLTDKALQPMHKLLGAAQLLYVLLNRLNSIPNLHELRQLILYRIIEVGNTLREILFVLAAGG